MELFALEVRADFTVPLETADAFSATTMVTRSSTWLARKSRPRSASRDDGDHSEPVVFDSNPWSRCVASRTYVSSAELFAPFLFLAARQSPATRITIQTCRITASP